MKLKKLISLDKLFFMKRQIITACVFLHNEGKVLVGKRSNRKSFLPGKWELPGGHVEFSETIGQCLKRELQEEFKKNLKCKYNIILNLDLRSFVLTKRTL